MSDRFLDGEVLEFPDNLNRGGLGGGWVAELSRYRRTP